MNPNQAKKITIAELRANYHNYAERMKAGEIFSIVDLEESEELLHQPLEDGTGMSINVEKIIE